MVSEDAAPRMLPVTSSLSTATGWMRAVDAAYAAEDEEGNQEQAERNSQMRSLLQQRRSQRPVEARAVAPEEVMTLAAKQGEDAAERGGGLGVGAAAEECRPGWFVERLDMENPVLRLHEELLDFAEFVTHNKAEARARKQWVKTISIACRRLWPECKVRVFGSFSTGLSLCNGDVDLAVLDVPARPGPAMKMLADLLLADGAISWLEIIESAKVPIIKLRAQASGLRADVCFNLPDGLATSKFIRERCEEYPQMRPLLLFLKYFLLQRGLHETYTGGMGSYLLCNVVLHFLQRHPSKRDNRHYAATSLGHLLFDFMKYYGQEFKYESTGISVRDGGYTFDKTQRAWRGNRRAGGGACLSLESPLGPPNDIGGPCFRMAILRNLFQHALNCMSHLYVTRASPKASLLCPLLLDPTHPVIAGRHKLMAEQPAALPGLVRQASGGSLRSGRGGASSSSGSDSGLPPSGKRPVKAGEGRAAKRRKVADA